VETPKLSLNGEVMSEVMEKITVSGTNVGTVDGFATQIGTS
jgi:hypothetical protein